MENQPDTENQKEEEQPKVQPKVVVYCEACSLPLEFCEYAQPPCKNYLQTHQKDETKQKEEQKQDQSKNQEKQAKDKQSSQDEQKEETKNVQNKPREKAKKGENTLTVTLQQRTKRKCITIVSGISQFKLNLKELTKKLKNKYACGCSIGDNEDSFELQGDFKDTIESTLRNEYKVELEKVKFAYEEKK